MLLTWQQKKKWNLSASRISRVARESSGAGGRLLVPPSDLNPSLHKTSEIGTIEVVKSPKLKFKEAHRSDKGRNAVAAGFIGVFFIPPLHKMYIFFD